MKTPTGSLTLALAALLCLAAPQVALAGLSADPQAVPTSEVPGPAAPVAGALAFQLDDGSAENSIGDAGQFIWINRFTPNPADFPFLLEKVDVLFGDNNVTLGGAIEIVLHEDTDGDGDPGTGASFLASYTDTVQFNDGVTFSSYSLVPPLQIDGPGDLLVGVINRYGSEGFNDFPARIDTTASQVRSWAASYLAGDVPAMPTYPADEQWGTIDSFGFPGNWMVRAFGTRILDADLVITKDGVLGGDQIVYTLGVTNNGPDDATGVVVTDPLSPDVTFVGDDCGGMVVPPWTWTIGNLAANSSVVCNLTVMVNVGAVSPITNTANVTSDQTDPSPGNESATEVISLAGTLEIPTLGKLGLLLLVAILAGAAIFAIRRW